MARSGKPRLVLAGGRLGLTSVELDRFDGRGLWTGAAERQTPVG